MRYVPLALLAVFVVADVAANWRVAGMESVSELIWARGGWVQAGCALGLVVLASHIGFKWPYGPSAP